MKHSIYTLLLLLLCFCFSNCERELMDYEGESSIYFDVRLESSFRDSSQWSRRYYSTLNFIEHTGDAVEMILPVAISGEVTPYDRTVEIEVLTDSCTAVEGVDFDVEKSVTLPAGAHIAYVTFTGYRHDYLEDNIITAMLRVKGNQYFTTTLTFDRELDGRDALMDEYKKYNPDPRFHTVELTLSVKKPEDWWGWDYPDLQTEIGPFGAFSSKKYLLMLKVLDWTESMFASAIKGNKDRAKVMAKIFAEYLVEQYNAGTPVLEKDGRLMWVDCITQWSSYQYEW